MIMMISHMNTYAKIYQIFILNISSIVCHLCLGESILKTETKTYRRITFCYLTLTMQLFDDDAFELWYWRRLLRVPWTAKRSNQSILKEISPKHSLEGLMLKLKLQYFDHLIQRAAVREDPDSGKDWRQEVKGMTEDEMVGWHKRLDGHEFGQAWWVNDRQRSLACWSRRGHKESDMTEPLDWTELMWLFSNLFYLCPCFLACKFR